MFNMTMNVIQLKKSIEGALASVVPNIPKEQTNPMDWEFTPVPIVLLDLAMNLEQKFKKGVSWALAASSEPLLLYIRTK